MIASSRSNTMLPMLPAGASTSTPEGITAQLKRKSNEVYSGPNAPNDRFTTRDILQASSEAGSCAETAIALDSSDDESDRNHIAERIPPVKTARVTPIVSTIRANESHTTCSQLHDRGSSDLHTPEQTITVGHGDTAAPARTTDINTSARSESCSNGPYVPVASAIVATPASVPAVGSVQPLRVIGSIPPHGASGGTYASATQDSTPTPPMGASTSLATPPSAPLPDIGQMQPVAPVAKTVVRTPEGSAPAVTTQTPSASAGGHVRTGAMMRSTLNGAAPAFSATSQTKPKRRPGRPCGSKNRHTVKDPPYIAPNLNQDSGIIVPTVASRPKRQPGRRMRWADEMMNPGEQWLRKGAKEPPALPPNPVDASFPEAPTFYPNIDEFRDPLSYIETIRPVAEMYGIAKIVPPDGWQPPETPLKDHINKLLPTKKQALHSLMNSDEVYDEGREFTMFEYKVMADNFAKKWTKRAPPPELKRKCPRRVKTELLSEEALRSSRLQRWENRRWGDVEDVLPRRKNGRVPYSMPFAARLQHNFKSETLAAGTSAAVKSELASMSMGIGAPQTTPIGTPVETTPSAAASMAPAATGLPVDPALQANTHPNIQPTAGVSVKDEIPTEFSATTVMDSILPSSPDSNSSSAYTESRLRELEREYWNVVDGGAEDVEVEYANDLDISEFWSGFSLPPPNYMDGSSFDRTKPCRFEDPEYYRTCGWNLNNLPFWPGSVLRFFRTHINGLTAPWLYLGMQFATFAWHNEDNYLYSLNYHHSGAPKQWYGVPGKHARGFEACLARVLGETLDTVSEHLYRITKMLSPVYLQRDKVPVYRLVQDPGQFVVTFPKAYHGGFSYGYNCGEAVNFAVPDWISYSRESTEAYRQAGRTAALSHDKMVATLTMYLPDHDVKGCELVLRELKRIQMEELQGRRTLELEGAQDPSKQGLELPKFGLGLIDQDMEEYDERRTCKTCKHRLFMTGVACRCNDLDVSCLRCVKSACTCLMTEKYLLSWWTENDLSQFVKTAETYLSKLRTGRVDGEAIESFNANINPFT